MPVLYTKDHTDHAATELQALRDEVQSLRQQLRHSQRLATIGTMAAMIAHEFNNILTPVVNYAQLAQNRPELVEKALGKAIEGGIRAGDICQAILGLARHVPPAKCEPFALSQLTVKTLTAMARDPQKDDIEIDLDIPPSLRLAVGRVELQQVLLNLILNARQAVMDRPAPRKIRISGRREDEKVRISVQDNGLGIPPENFEKIFQPFFSTRSDRDGAERGHGLGLAICREIVLSMDGQLDVESEVNVGSTFTIHLPCRLG